MSQLASPRYLLSVLWRRMPVILLVLLIGLPGAVWFALQQPRLFEATAVIQIENPQVAEQLTGAAVLMTGTDNQLELIQQKLMARDTITGIVEKYGLFEGLAPGVQVGLLRESVTMIKLIDPAQSWRAEGHPSGLAITVRLNEAELAAALANEFATLVVSEAQTRAEGRANRTLDFFVTEEARVSEAILEVEARLADFKRANNAALPEALGAQRDRLTRLTESQIALDQQIIELQTSGDRVRGDELTRQTALLEQQRELIAQNIRQIEAALLEAPEVERQLTSLNRQLEQLNAEYTVITQRRTEAAMSQLLESQDQAARFEILETAQPPEFPVSASRKKIALAGGIAALVAALGLALVLETMNKAIRTASQLEAQLGVRPVIVVPHLQSRRSHIIGWGRWLLVLVGLLAAGWAALSGRLQELLDSLPLPRALTRGGRA